MRIPSASELSPSGGMAPTRVDFRPREQRVAQGPGNLGGHPPEPLGDATPGTRAAGLPEPSDTRPRERISLSLRTQQYLSERGFTMTTSDEGRVALRNREGYTLWHGEPGAVVNSGTVGDGTVRFNVTQPNGQQATLTLDPYLHTLRGQIGNDVLQRWTEQAPAKQWLPQLRERIERGDEVAQRYGSLREPNATQLAAVREALGPAAAQALQGERYLQLKVPINSPEGTEYGGVTVAGRAYVGRLLAGENGDGIAANELTHVAMTHLTEQAYRARFGASELSPGERRDLTQQRLNGNWYRDFQGPEGIPAPRTNHQVEELLSDAASMRAEPRTELQRILSDWADVAVERPDHQYAMTANLAVQQVDRVLRERGGEVPSDLRQRLAADGIAPFNLTDAELGTIQAAYRGVSQRAFTHFQAQLPTQLHRL